MVNKIIIAVDDSKASEKALEHAIDLATDVSAEILLVSVIPHSFIPAFSLPTAPTPSINANATITFLESSRIHYKKVISKFLKRIQRINPNLKISAKIVEGNPADEIIKIAKDENSDLIIVGNKNHSGIHKFFLGSVSDDVIHSSEIPVLVVK